MDSPINKIDELLSGKLDGVLSEAESIELAREMAKDPSLESRLDDFAALRKSLMSGRSTKRLRPDFASSVTLSAQKRAADLGEKAPIWLTPVRLDGGIPETKTERTLVLPNELRRSSRFLFAGAFTLAAALLIAFFAYPRPQESNFTGEGLVMQPENSNANPDSSATPRIAAEDATRSPESTPEQSQGILAQSDAKSIPPTNSLEMETPTKKNSSESVASLEPPAIEPNKAVASAPVVRTDTKPAQKPSTKTPLLLVFDLQLDEKAIENRVLERILEKHGIVYTDDLVLDDEQLAKLQESQLIGPPNVEEKMGVMFVRSTALSLGLALEEIIVDAADFPAFGMDLATHGSIRVLVEQLSGIQVAESPKGFAGRLSLANSRGNPTPFAASVSRAKPTTGEARNFTGLLPEHKELSNVLFLLRPAKK